MRKIKVFILFAIMSTICLGQENFRLPAIISDNMVLQQNSEVPIWGFGNPNEIITISPEWTDETSVTVKNDSTWSVNLRTPSAGGPYTINIIGKNQRIELENILIGEVWLCSGQSNMEMPLEGWPPTDLIDNSAQVIANSENDNIRFFTVVKDISVIEQSDCKGNWTASNPKTSTSFSATAYFFGKKLYDELKIPIGLIHSSWGGTPAEAWTSKEFLIDLGEYDSVFSNIALSIPQSKKLEKWLDQFPQLNLTGKTTENMWKNLDFDDKECSSIEFEHKNWDTMTLPVKWEQSELGEFDGAVWFRKTIELEDEWLNQELRIELGPIDDFDLTFVNGVNVGGIEEDGNWKTPRKYNIEKSVNNHKNLVIAVRVNDSRGGGGIYGKPEEMKLVNITSKKELPLAGEWHYLPVAEFKGNNYFVFGSKDGVFRSRPKLPIAFSSNTPTLLYNAMIAPLVPFKLKGFIWYQGESNAGMPELYERLFPSMINNWRRDFGADLPFYFVQIAPYDYGEYTKSEFLRDAQRKTLMLDNTGMAVTLDIGNVNNIHPANKKDVGERLALWGLGKLYGKENLVISGPLYKSMIIKGNKIEIEFEHTGTGLLLKNDGDQFMVAGADKNFKVAKSKIEGNKLLVWSDEISYPFAVRYAWDNKSEAVLFNKEGLPASSFRTDNW